jgi:tetratricopeptide (TPR) repeat protein
MELVRGTPITRYCDEQRLTPKERLELFLPICAAVQHAHQKGIIHRDLKPSNVLVGLYDGKPVPKIIDFGVAKAMGQKLTEQTLFTGFGQVVGTPEYMSPEQAQLDNVDIDTRSDIYSLGVLLYELLTGTTPLQHKRVREAALLEVLRLIREEEPQKPSTRLSSTDELSSIAANRNLEPRKLTGLVHGDLDWIVMKSLEKDRGRRYETTSAFAADVERYLADEPVQACPPSAIYRLRKFVRRHKGPVVAATVVLLSLLAGITGTTLGFVRASAALELVEAQQKRVERYFQKALDAVDRMLTSVGEKQLAEVPQMEETRQRLLEDALEFYQGFVQEQSSDASVRRETARAYQRTAHIYRMLGRHDDAERQYGEALFIYQGLATEFAKEPTYSQDLADTHRFLGELLSDKGRFDSAEGSFKDALRILTALTSSHPNTEEFKVSQAAACNSLGGLYRDSGRLDLAELQYSDALRIRNYLAQQWPENFDFLDAQAESHESMGQIYAVMGRRMDAKDELQEAVRIREQLVHKSPQTSRHREQFAKSLSSLGSLYQSCGQLDHARAAYERALSVTRRLAEDHPKVPDYQDELAKNSWRLAEVCYYAQKPSEGADHFKRAAVILEGLVRDYPTQLRYAHDLGECCERIGMVLRQSGRVDEALALFERAIHVLADVLRKQPDHSDAREQLSVTHMARAGTLLQLGREDEARKDWERMVELGEDQTNIDTRIWRAQGLAHLGEHEKAISEVEEMLAGRREPQYSQYNVACVFSICSRTVNQDDDLSADERRSLAQDYAARAVRMLVLAHELGFFNTPGFVEVLKTDPDIKPLESRQDFKALVRELEHGN